MGAVAAAEYKKYKNCLIFSGLSVSNSIDILREKLLVLMVLRDTLRDIEVDFRLTNLFIRILKQIISFY